MMDRIEKILQLIERFFSWWLGEMRSMIPENLTKFFVSSEDENKFYISANSVTVVSFVEGKKCEKKIEGSFFDLIDGEEFAKNITGLCTVYLMDDLILQRSVALPKAIKNDFKNVIKFQLSSLLPLRENEIFYDCLIVGDGDHGDCIKVQLAMIKRSLAERLEACFVKVDLRLKNICFASSINSLPDLEFLSLDKKYKTKNRNLVGGLLATTAALLFLCGLALDESYDARERKLNARLVQLSEKSKEVLVIKDEFDSRTGLIELSQKRRNRVNFAQILETLTVAIPEDSWVYDYRQAGRKISLTGTSPNSSVIVSRLSNISLFEEIANEVTNISGEGKESVERFTLSMKLLAGDDDE